MRYRTFDEYQKGFSHVEKGTECEDCADSYADPEGRFFICVVCDGHSDNNCFRSAKGAKYGCEAAKNVLTRFFELYYEEEGEKIALSEDVELRLKKGIKQYWDEKVLDDIENKPITEAEKRLLSDRVRAVYESGHGLQNIYGATFLAVGISEDLCIALHIGDGIMMFVDKDGTYYEPLEADAKSEMGSPASLCDTDLFSRKSAFRCKFVREIPLAVVASSDGIGDCMDQLQFMEFFHSLIKEFKSRELEIAEAVDLSDLQKEYLEQCVCYYTKKGNGVEDDCSLAGIYNLDSPIPQVKIPLEMAKRLWDETIRERNDTIQDYEKRKRDAIDNIERQMPHDADLKSDTYSWMEAKGKVESLKEALRNIVNNEKKKTEYYESKLNICEEYIIRAGGKAPIRTNLIRIVEVDECYLEEDAEYRDLRSKYDDMKNKNAKKKEIDDQLKEAEHCRHEAMKRIIRANNQSESMEAESWEKEFQEEIDKLRTERKESMQALEDSKKAFVEAISKYEKKKKKVYYHS